MAPEASLGAEAAMGAEAFFRQRNRGIDEETGVVKTVPPLATGR